MATPKFTLRDLSQMLKNLGTLATSSEGRQLLVRGIKHSIRRSRMGGAMLDKVELMYDFFRDPAEPLKPKAMIGAALLYLVIPNDLIPDWIPLVGFTDDFAAIAIVWQNTKDVLLNYDARRRQRQAD